MKSLGSIRFSKKWSGIFGAFLLVVTTPFAWSWGNTYIYALSYLIKHNPPSSYIIQPWTSSLNIIFYSVGFIASGQMYKFVRKKIVMACGLAFCSGGVFLTAWSIRRSVTGLHVTQGCMVGFGNGMVNAVGFQYATDWADDDVALLMGIVLAGNNVGALLETTFVTMYINPDNLIPDTTIRNYKLFTQDVVVDRVPSMFLVLGACYVVIQGVGFVLLRDKPPCDQLAKAKDPPNYTDEVGQGEEGTSQPGFVSPEHEVEECPPRRMVRTREFYILALAFIAVDLANFVVTTYYKEFGLLYIHDDHFVMFTGLFMFVGVFTGNILWGYVMDKIGVKNCLVIYLSILSTCMMFYNICPMISRWLYFLASIAVSNCLVLITIFAAAMVKLFGKEHLACNFGIVTLPDLVCEMFAPVVFEKSISYMGWHSIFDMPAILCSVNLIAIILCMPHDREKKGK